MSIYALIILALGMSMDAFAAALAKGASLNRPSVKEVIRTGLIFGCIEAITPLIGWAIGHVASKFIMSWDHWVAFGLLLVLGGKMIFEGLRQNEEECEQSARRHGFWLLVTTAVATSLDAMAVGVGLAFLQVNILLTALMIGAATTIMATTGMFLGRVLGEKIGKWAEIFGGTVLIVIGAMILCEHLGWIG